MQKQITTDRRKQLAAEHGVNLQYLYQCLTGRRDMNPAEAMRLETESGKELTRQMLCQKTYAGIWPDLVKANPTLDAQLTEADKAGLIECRTVVHRADDRAMRARLAAGEGA